DLAETAIDTDFDEDDLGDIDDLLVDVEGETLQPEASEESPSSDVPTELDTASHVESGHLDGILDAEEQIPQGYESINELTEEAEPEL
ncbi:hypothetical protein, partial [Pseudoalteromonas luteoviolacea]|uniref:hypothetical protein n=1 Tax=Pseudoalteromonas luteoviolacea TaxID=43657 RepID=UPI000AF97C34